MTSAIYAVQDDNVTVFDDFELSPKTLRIYYFALDIQENLKHYFDRRTSGEEQRLIEINVYLYNNTIYQVTDNCLLDSEQNLGSEFGDRGERIIRVISERATPSSLGPGGFYVRDE